MHPVVIPCITTMLYFSRGGTIYDANSKIFLLLLTFLGTYVVPVCGLLVLKQVNLIDSLTIPKVEQRKYPSLIMLIVSISFTILFQYKFYDPNLKHFYLGSILSVVLLLIAQRSKLKISIHMIGISSLLGFVLYISYNFKMNELVLIASLSLLSGLVAWSRLYLGAHTKTELFLGLLLGVLPQIILH